MLLRELLFGHAQRERAREIERERERKLTEFCGSLGPFCEKLGEFTLAHKY